MKRHCRRIQKLKLETQVGMASWKSKKVFQGRVGDQRKATDTEYLDFSKTRGKTCQQEKESTYTGYKN
jgi:hypothetical protein